LGVFLCFYFVPLQVMRFLYNSSIAIASLLLSLIAVFNQKIKLFVDGRKETFVKLSVLATEKNTVWVHAASLGEFEQGRPIIEKIKAQYPQYKIVLTFFSPSGYEIQKEYELADVVCYLPLDSKKNAAKFLELVQPKVAIFIKYELWPNFLKELQKRKISTLLVSGIFRKEQIFFKSYGRWMRKSLATFDHFFVQDDASKQLLKTIQLENVTVSGDTRFDRVSAILQQDNHLDFVSQFKNNNYTVVAGSTWKEDEALLVNYINEVASDDEKFIIAPHNINQKEIEALKKAIAKKTVLFSEMEAENLSEAQVLIIDTIGLLTKIYASGDAAYVGGGLTKSGLHNVLEPATFGLPIVIGPTYKKYKEVVDLVALKGCKVIADQVQFSAIFTRLKADVSYREKTGQINKKYIQENIGATGVIMKYVHEKLNR